MDKALFILFIFGLSNCSNPALRGFNGSEKKSENPDTNSDKGVDVDNDTEEEKSEDAVEDSRPKFIDLFDDTKNEFQSINSNGESTIGFIDEDVEGVIGGVRNYSYVTDFSRESGFATNVGFSSRTEPSPAKYFSFGGLGAGGLSEFEYAGENGLNVDLSGLKQIVLDSFASDQTADKGNLATIVLSDGSSESVLEKPLPRRRTGDDSPSVVFPIAEFSDVGDLDLSNIKNIKFRISSNSDHDYSLNSLILEYE